MGTKYLTTDEIIEIHDRIIEKSGGHFGIISFGNLDFLVSQTTIPKTLERKTATLFYGILTSHPFVDGNKRTALVAAQIFLEENGKKFTAENDDIWNIVYKCSEGKFKLEETAIWIKKNMK